MSPDPVCTPLLRSRPVGVLPLLLPLLLLPATPSQAQDLPPADELIAAYVEAIGGADAHAAPVSVRTSGTVSLPAMGVAGTFELLQIVSVGSRMTTSIPGVGEMHVGFDGEHGWSLNQVTGPALMTDAEVAQIRERSLLAATLRGSEVVEEAETVERTEVEGEPCWRVRLRWASGRESFDCYHAETGLLVRSEDVQVSEMGELPVTSLFEEYRDFEGMRLPTRLIQETMGMRQVMEVTSVVVDDADESALAPPPAIRTLLEGH
jgi:zinc protease